MVDNKKIHCIKITLHFDRSCKYYHITFAFDENLRFPMLYSIFRRKYVKYMQRLMVEKRARC